MSGKSLINAPRKASNAHSLSTAPNTRSYLSRVKLLLSKRCQPTLLSSTFCPSAFMSVTPFSKTFTHSATGCPGRLWSFFITRNPGLVLSAWHPPFPWLSRVTSAGISHLRPCLHECPCFSPVERRTLSSSMVSAHFRAEPVKRDSNRAP